ncbi:MAG: TIGR02679 family protein [Pseudonocardia sp.]|uniref:TIGR02679 family protein n=1 Tax=Pseudonocardia sp. TaxID=60912 RepID=UPI001AD41890|nr:TIGR02679 family protein [Pseudonocardia sp.]MBN9096624.1 TIGR02679 family protein [Pseudonocardia sp.]
MSSDERLRRLLGGPELSWLVERVRRRLARNEPATGVVTLSRATPAQRDALERLLGRRPRAGSGVSVRLEDIDDLVRRSGVHPAGLAAAVVALTGPVTDRAALATELDAAWTAAFAPLHAAVAERPELHGWADGLLATGAVRRITRDPDGAAALLERLARAVDALPVDAEPLGRFAERVLDSAHALDANQPLSSLLFGAARALGGVPDGQGASWRREVWAAVGLVRDALSSTVLTLGLPGDPTSPTGRMIGALSDAGEPAVLTLRQLTRDMPRLAMSGCVVSVCENPVVVAAVADQLGPRSSPLICTSGQPGAAVMALLIAADRAGATLRYHGDFDWGGLRIGNVLFRRLPFAPWRFDAASYRRVAAGGHPLAGTPVAASWDPDLDGVMHRHGWAVEEERVLDELLADLCS